MALKSPGFATNIVAAAEPEKVREILLTALIILENPALMVGRSNEELAEFLLGELQR